MVMEKLNEKIYTAPIPNEGIEDVCHLKFKSAERNLQYMADTVWSPDNFNTVCANIQENVRQTDERFRKFTSADILACIKVEDTPEKYYGARQNKRSRRVRFSTGMSISVDNLFDSDIDDGSTQEQMPELSFSDINSSLIEVPPISQTGDSENEIINAYWEDMKTPGYGRKDGQSCTRYNNPFDPRLTFDGLGYLFSNASNESGKSREVGATQNVCLAMENPQKVFEDYYNGYTQFLNDLSEPSEKSRQTEHTQGENKVSHKQVLISDDETEGCKLLFDKIQSNAIKEIWSGPTESFPMNPSPALPLRSNFSNQQQQTKQPSNVTPRVLYVEKTNPDRNVAEHNGENSVAIKTETSQEQFDLNRECWRNSTINEQIKPHISHLRVQDQLESSIKINEVSKSIQPNCSKPTCENSKFEKLEETRRREMQLVQDANSRVQLSSHWSNMQSEPVSQLSFSTSLQNPNRKQDPGQHVWLENKKPLPADQTTARAQYNTAQPYGWTNTGIVSKPEEYQEYTDHKPVLQELPQANDPRQDTTMKRPVLNQILPNMNMNINQEQTHTMTCREQGEQQFRQDNITPTPNKTDNCRSSFAHTSRAFSHVSKLETPQVERLYPQLEDFGLLESYEMSETETIPADEIITKGVSGLTMENKLTRESHEPRYQLRPTSQPFVPASQKILRATAQPWQGPQDTYHRESVWPSGVEDKLQRTKQQINKPECVPSVFPAQPQQTTFWQQPQFNVQSRASAGQQQFMSYLPVPGTQPSWSSGERPVRPINILGAPPIWPAREQRVLADTSILQPTIGLTNIGAFHLPVNSPRLPQPPDPLRVCFPPPNTGQSFALGASNIIGNKLSVNGRVPQTLPLPTSRMHTPVFQQTIPVQQWNLNSSNTYYLNVNNNAKESDEILNNKDDDEERREIPTLIRSNYSHSKSDANLKQHGRPHPLRSNLVQIETNN